MPRVVFNCHVMGVPNGGSSITYNEGDVVDLPDEQYELLEGRRTLDGRRWISSTTMEPRRYGPIVVKKTPKRKTKEPTLRYECEYCGKRWRYPSDLEKHVWKVHEREKGPYICGECGKQYETYQALAGHVKGHRSGVNRIDPVTGAKIPKNVRLDRTPTGPNRCPYCVRSFTTVGGLKVHIGVKHPGESTDV
jgi:DNA-directed RNA polymerase subunit RPC12/RpoP